MAEGPRIERRIASPDGSHLGVRASVDGRGWWAGVPKGAYDATAEARCGQTAVARVTGAAHG